MGLTAGHRAWYTEYMGRESRGRPKARVFILSGPSLFGEGIRGLLCNEPGLEIVGRETDPQEAMRRIKEAPPDVVILTDAEAATELEAELLRLVREGFRMRIVEVHQATNTLCLYCGERQSIREVGDLVETVRHVCEGLTRDAQLPLTPAMGQPIV